MATDVYKLEVRMNIVKYQRDESGYDRHTQERLEVNETIDLGTLDFAEVMGVLGSMHTAVSAVKDKR